MFGDSDYGKYLKIIQLYFKSVKYGTIEKFEKKLRKPDFIG